MSHDNVRIANNYAKIAYCLIAAIGIIGNLMVIFVMVKSSAMRNTYTNILILNQSSIDFVASILILLTTVMRKPVYDLSGVAGELFCRLWLTDLPLWSLLISSSYTLMALTLERYMSIVHPITHFNWFSKRKVLVMAVVAWSPGFVLNSFFIVLTSRVVDGRCKACLFFVSDSWKRAAGVIVFVIQYLVPTLCFITCYSRIFLYLRRRVEAEPQASGNAAAAEKARVRRNVLKTLVIIVVCYIVCNSWNQFAFLAFNFGVDLDYTGTFYHFTVILMFANCCINPVVYTVQYQRYKTELRKLFCKCSKATSTVAAE